MALDTITATARMAAAMYADVAHRLDLLGVLGDDPLDGIDPLEARDPAYIEATLPALRTFSDVYHRGDVQGLENIPADEPVLLVGNHSGGTLIADTFIFSQAFYDHFGTQRRFHQLAHDLVFQVPGIRGSLMRYGTVPANPDNMRRALERGAALLVYPGGDYESYRPSWESSTVDFGGRQGFVRLARELGVRIVPVVAIGGQETALFLSRGEGLSKFLGLDRLLRLKVLPISLAIPWGLNVGDMLGHFPLPAKIVVEALPPIHLREEFGEDPDVGEVYGHVTQTMQETLDALASERRLPILG